MLMGGSLRGWAGLRISVHQSHLESGMKKAPAKGSVSVHLEWAQAPALLNSLSGVIQMQATDCRWENRDTSPEISTVRRLCLQLSPTEHSCSHFIAFMTQNLGKSAFLPSGVVVFLG